MHYHKVSRDLYAAHRDDPKTLTWPEISQVGYVQREGKGWVAYLPTGLRLGTGQPYSTQDNAVNALVQHAMVTVARATWMK